MQIKIKESVVDEVTNFNYLGLHIQNNLGWKSHTLKITSVGNQAFPSTTKKSNTYVHEPHFFNAYDSMRNETESHVR